MTTQANPNGVDLKDTLQLSSRLKAVETVVGNTQPPERNTEGWLIALIIICATALTYLQVPMTEWAVLVGTLGVGYGGMRTYKKTQGGA